MTPVTARLPALLERLGLPSLLHQGRFLKASEGRFLKASEAPLAEVFPGKLLELEVGMRLHPLFTPAW